jgi:predicted protein tyrosine phosphatase
MSSGKFKPQNKFNWAEYIFIMEKSISLTLEVPFSHKASGGWRFR